MYYDLIKPYLKKINIWNIYKITDIFNQLDINIIQKYKKVIDIIIKPNEYQ